MTAPCSCTQLSVQEIVDSTDEPFTAILQIINCGWRHDESLAMFVWANGCERHMSDEENTICPK